jgi:hypothetical protein
MPFVSLPLAGINSLFPTVPRLLDIALSARQPEPLDTDSSLAIHQVLRLISLAHHHPVPTPEDCRLGIIQLFHESLYDDWTHGGLPVAPVMHVSDVVSRTLWHMRTCHPNPERLVLLSKIAKGVPKFKHPQDIEKCSDCLIVKLRKAARGKAPGFTVVSLGQGLTINVGFMFQRSKNAARAKRLTGVNGNNAYCVIYDFFYELVFGVTSRGKTIPLAWLHILLTRIAPRDTPGRIVRLDLGGETGKNPDIQDFFLKHGYILEPTGAGASSQNGWAERPHQKIGNAVRVMLCSADIPPKFWEYAFYFFLRIHAVLPHGKNTISPYQKTTLHMPDLSRLRTFGCRIYTLSTRRRQGKVTTNNIICGKLLGYGGSMKNFIYINNATRKIGRATQASFDEAQISTPVADLNSNSLALWGALNRNPGTTAPPVDEILTPPTKCCGFAGESPFLRVATSGHTHQVQF